MKPVALSLFSMLALLGGCAAAPTVRPTALAPTAGNPTGFAPLNGPYALRLTTNRPSAAPGEIVEVTAEFENTGSGVLWVPIGRQLDFGWRMSDGSITDMYSSQCSGLEYKKLRPGKKVTFLIGFTVPPDVWGDIKLYLAINRAVTVPLLIRAPGTLAPPAATTAPTPL